MLGRSLTFFNLDGYIVSSQNDVKGIHSYSQLYRNGIIEAVAGRLIREEKKTIPSGVFEHNIIQYIKHYLNILNILEITPPIFIFATLYKAKNFEMALPPKYIDWEKTPIDRDFLTLPETLIENYESDVPSCLKNCFDALWNACGFERSLNYDENGVWVGKF